MNLQLKVILMLIVLPIFTQQVMAIETVENKKAVSKYREGLEYKRIDPPVPLNESHEKIEIVEMFFYACPHCYELDPKIQTWLKNKPYVDFYRVPAIIGPTWADQARAFFISKELDGSEELHRALFEAIHKDGKQIYNNYSVIDFFVQQGYDSKKIEKLYYSKKIADAASRARIMTVKYKLRGIPAVAVNGKYITAPYYVRSQEDMLDVLDYLIEKERKDNNRNNLVTKK